MSSKRGRGGNKIGAAKARDILRSYIEKGKSKSYEEGDEDESVIFTVEDLQDMSKEVKEEPIKEEKVEKPKEEVKKEEVKIMTSNSDVYKEMYEKLANEMTKLKEEVTKKPKEIVIERTSKQIKDEALRNKLLNSFK